MYNNNKILVVIPARGGSKGIPRKNLRLLNNKPLIYYSIQTAKSSEYVDDVVVTTDDSKIALLSEKLGASVVRRSEELADDKVPLEPVIYNAMVQKEKLTFDEYDIVVTILPTAPLLKVSTLNRAIEKFDDFAVESVISVVDDRRLSWGFDENNQRYFPNYIQRVDVEDLPKDFKETGGILATRRGFVLENSCIGTNIDIIEVSREESVNIDTYEDWWIAENYLQKKRIAIVVDASDEIGTGHIYRCLSIASKLVLHDILFLLDESNKFGINLVENNNYPIKVYDGTDDLIKCLRQYSPQIVLNDILDTDQEYIKTLKDEGYFVVNFEDIGLGSELADVVFDDLYEHDGNKRNTFTDYKYYILKDEFYLQPPKTITPDVNAVLISLGANDSNRVTEKIIDSILVTNYKGRINVNVGADYPDLEGLIEKYESNNSVQIYQNVSNISEFMLNADLIFSANNTSIYDICSLGVPTICVSQNERQLTHVFANERNGFVNLGLGENVETKDIVEEFVRMVNDYELRSAMNRKMLSIDIKNGFEHIWHIIREEYRKFELSR